MRAEATSRQERSGIIVRLLERFGEQVEAGTACLVSGSPGTGKTHLVEQFLRELPASTPRLRGRGLQTGVAPLLPICEAIRSFGVGENIDQVRAVVEEYAETIPLLKLVLAPLFKAQLRTSHMRSRLRQVVPSETYTFVALARLLESLRGSQQLVLFIDDLQWADASSIEFLGYYATQLRSQRVLLLLVRRMDGQDLEQVASLIETIRREAGERVIEVSLGGLTRAEQIALIESLLGPIELLPADLDWLESSTQGKPYYLRELVELLRREGLLEKAGGAWRLRRHGDAKVVPPSLHRHLRERLSRIWEGDGLSRDVVQFAACAGTAFDAAVVAEALGQPTRTIGLLLDSFARKTGLIGRRGRTTEFFFDHDLTREAILSDLGDFAQEIHGKLAVTLASRPRVAPELVAFQFAASSDHLSASDWYAQAAERDLENSLFHSALRNSQLAESSLARTSSVPAARLVRSTVLVAKSLMATGRHEETLALIAPRLPSVPASDSARLYYLLGRAAARLPQTSRHAEAVAHLRKSLELLGSEETALTRAEVLTDLTYAYDAVGDVASSQASFRSAIVEARKSGQRSLLVRLMRLTCIFWQPEKVVEATQQALRLARQSHLKYESALCENNLGSAYFALGDMADAYRHFEAAYRMLKNLGGYQCDVPLNNIGVWHLSQGQRPKAETLLRGAMAASHDGHNRLFIGSNLSVLEAVGGDLRSAQERLAGLAKEAALTGDLFYINCINHNWGNSLLALGRADEAIRVVSSSPLHHSKSDGLLVRGKRAKLLIRAYAAKGVAPPAGLLEEAEVLDKSTKHQVWLYRLPWYLCDIEFWED
jgi:tetratricopeptide (TPR) repeat protein